MRTRTRERDDSARGRPRRGRRAVVRLAIALAVAGIVSGLAAAIWIALPVPVGIADPGPVPSLVLQDRNGLDLRTTRSADGSRGGWLPIESIDAELIQAFVAAEDQRFFDHRGIDVRAVVRATRDNLKSRSIVSGASTLTMQAARLLVPANRTWAGKLKQTMWALRLERHLDKSRILEAYLNRVPLGQGAVGVEAAARLYFDASATDLSLGQAALLAGLTHQPARLNPIRSRDRARERRDYVLARMQSLGFATPTDVGLATREPVEVAGGSTRFVAPHFTTRLLSDIEANTTGTIRTTLDLELQSVVESEVRHAVLSLQDRETRHAAAVVLDNRSGDVLAWVGSPDFFADTAGQVDMVVSRRQPGSTLKPFLYGLAFDNDNTPATVLPDVPRTYATSTGPYRPQNYDRRFHGPVRIREALASSFNVPAVEMTDRLGAAALLRVLHEAGFESLDRTPDHYGLGLALGNGEVTLLELANAYRGIANGGVWRPINRIADQGTGMTLTAAGMGADDDAHRFISAGAAVLVLDILRDPVARIPGFGESTPLDLPFPAATKTGTSRHFTDNWAVATAANFTVAVWVGNFDGHPMEGVSGITGAGPLLYRIALETARRYPPGWLPAPEQLGAEPVAVCALSGLRATPDCPSLVEWFLPGTAPERTDDWQVAGRTTYPDEYAEWVTAHDRSGEDAELIASAERGAEDVTEHYRILSPLDGDTYETPPGVDARYATIPLMASPGAGVRWQIDGQPFTAPRWKLIPGNHTLTATWAAGRTDTVRVTVAPPGVPPVREPH